MKAMRSWIVQYRARLAWCALWSLMALAVVGGTGWANHIHVQEGPFGGIVLGVMADRTTPQRLYAVVYGGWVLSALALADPAQGDLIERGRMLYTQHCAVCHGAEGQGRVRGNATALNNPDFLAWASDALLQATIARGRRGTEMPGWAREAGGPLDGDDMRALVAFLRSWQQDIPKPPAPPVGQGNAVRGRQLYEMACANCHGWEGRGELGKGPALNNPDFLAAADDTFLWATLACGRRETPMFPSLRGLGGVRQFTEAEINDLVAYLRSWQRPR